MTNNRDPRDVGDSSARYTLVQSADPRTEPDALLVTMSRYLLSLADVETLADKLDDMGETALADELRDALLDYVSNLRLTCTECGRVGNTDDGISVGSECQDEECPGMIVEYEGVQP